MRDLEHFKNKTGRSDNIKYSQIRKYRRASTPADLTYREVHMIKGSVWSIHDRDVPFEGGRIEESYKDYSRPALVTETPESYQENDLVNIAPGSSLPGYSTGGIMDLVAWVPGEALLKTTYFRVFMRYDTPQKLLFRKLTDLSAQLVTKLDNMLTPAK